MDIPEGRSFVFTVVCYSENWRGLALPQASWGSRVDGLGAGSVMSVPGPDTAQVIYKVTNKRNSFHPIPPTQSSPIHLKLNVVWLSPASLSDLSPYPGRSTLLRDGPMQLGLAGMYSFLFGRALTPNFPREKKPTVQSQPHSLGAPLH